MKASRTSAVADQQQTVATDCKNQQPTVATVADIFCAILIYSTIIICFLWRHSDIAMSLWGGALQNCGSTSAVLLKTFCAISIATVEKVFMTSLRCCNIPRWWTTLKRFHLAAAVAAENFCNNNNRKVASIRNSMTFIDSRILWQIKPCFLVQFYRW